MVLAVLLLTLGFTGKGHAQTSVAFKDTTKIESNWYHLDWFGYFMVQDDEWIYHLEHGWMYFSGVLENQFWVHDMELGWWWVHHLRYPYVFSEAKNDWMWYIQGSTTPRWFYCFCNCSWESKPETIWVVPPGPPAGMVELAGGTFTMGQDLFGISYSLPEHQVTLEKFYIGTREVTKALWDEVYVWALCNDYTFDNVGKAVSSEHPLSNVNWYDVVKWCNAFSQYEHRTPAYYTDSTKTTVYKSGNLDLGSDSVDWTANGYRLPTESEWEYASRGGLAGKNYPWGDEADPDLLNYGISPGEGLLGGQYPSNGFGLFDLAGNLAEWTWDWFGTYPSGAQSNPKGINTGDHRVYRGGSFGSDFSRTRCADRDFTKPWNALDNLGFRLVMSAE